MGKIRQTLRNASNTGDQVYEIDQVTGESRLLYEVPARPKSREAGSTPRIPVAPDLRKSSKSSCRRC